MGLFQYGQDDGPFGVGRAFSEPGGGSDSHVGHVTDRDRRRSPHRDNSLRDIVEVLNSSGPTDEIFLPLLHEHAARGVHVGAFSRLQNVLQTDIEGGQQGGAAQNLILLDVPT